MENPKGCWRQCVAAALALFCTLGLNINAFSVYLPYFSKFLQLTPNQSACFQLVRDLLAVAGVFLAKGYYNKLDVRLGFSLAVALSAVSAFLYAWADSFYGLCAISMLSGLSYGLGGMYPVAILIHRWFPRHESVAMGICAACSGLAITVAAPLITALIEHHSMALALYCQTAFLLVVLAVCCLLICNYPDGELHFREQTQKQEKRPLRLDWMFFAILVLGMLGGAYSCLTLHYTTEGFHPYQISTLVSVFGLVLTASKVLLGGMISRWGAYPMNWVIFSLTILSCLLFSLGGSAGYGVMLTAGCLFGIGDSVATVGVTAYAKDLSRPENFTTTQQQYQIATMLGRLLCMMIPGFIATYTGSYRLFYVFIAGLMVFSTVVVQLSYVKNGLPRGRRSKLLIK